MAKNQKKQHLQFYVDCLKIGKEIWVPIKPKPYNKYYEVSNFGRVRSIDKIVKYNTKNGLKKGRILKQCIRGMYLTVILSHKQIHKQFTAHYLVASAFIPNPQKKPTVNHKKGNKLDNRVSELEWATRSEQMLHAIKMGLHTPPPIPTIGKFGYDHNRSKTVLQYELNGTFIAEYGSARQAAFKKGFTQVGISWGCRNGKMYKGFKWAYKNEL